MLGNKPGRDSGDVLVRLSNGDEFRRDTDNVMLTDAGLVLGSADSPERFIPMGSIVDISNAPDAGGND